MADQLFPEWYRESERWDPPRDLDYWLGEALRAPVRDIPTVEDWQREQGEVLPPDATQSRETGRGALDYVTTLLGPLLALYTSKQYARQGSGRPSPTWKDQADFTQANSPEEQLRQWYKTKPWEHRPPIGDSAWTYRSPPQIGGPTGQGMSKPDILAAIEKEKFQAMLKQIREMEAREASGLPPRNVRPQGQQIDDDRLDWLIQHMWKQGGADPGGPFKLPPLPGD